MREVREDLIGLALLVIELGYSNSEAVPIRDWNRFNLPATPRIFRLLDAMVYVLRNQDAIDKS